jgi:membrane protease YdiL (CAAX protease family)
VRIAPDEPRFTLGIALGAWVCAFLLASIGGAIILSLTGYADDGTGDYPLWLVAVLQVPLWIGLAGGCWLVSRRWGTGDLVRDYGLDWEPIDLLGIPVGIVTQLIFVPVLYELLWFIDTDDLSEPAENLTDKARGGLAAVLLVLLVVVVAPVVEELFFRGLLMRSISARWSDGIAIVGSSVLFGLAHFQLLQLPALILFGLVAGYSAYRTGRLGPAIMAHVGFSATTVFLLLRG